MTYCEIMNRLDALRREVTKERLGFGADAEMLTPVQLEADLAEARRRLRA